MTSLPVAPSIVSLPPRPTITSVPLVPAILSLPGVPSIVGTLPLQSSGGIVISVLVVALGPPLRDAVWPVNTNVVDVPFDVVSVSVTLYLPTFANVCDVVGVVVVDGAVPSPKSHV
jgi:hypothetical protein